MRQGLRPFVVVCVLSILLVAMWCGFAVYESYTYTNTTTQRLSWPKGTGVRRIAEDLEAKNVIRSALFFELYLRFSDQAHLLKAGEYEFVQGATAHDVVLMLVNGKTIRYSLTIPEGYNLRQICQKLTSQKFMTDLECTQLTHDVSFLKDSAGIQSLEGYLFPETYLFDRQITPREIIHAMVDQFYKHITDDDLQKIREQGLTLHRFVTFASLVEKETGAEFERPLIAGVFYNRLKAGMLLQTDPSVIYGIVDFDGNLTRRHLETDTPYNTYTRSGLPIGPIASPGLSALRAVLNPKKTEAYYFVAKGGGEHYFSKTLSQHNRAVQYYIFKNGPTPEPGEETK